MEIKNKFIILIILMFSFSCFADVYVISNQSITIDPSDIPDIFLGDKQFNGNTRIIPVDNLSAQVQFLDKALKLEPAKYSSKWVKKTFRDGMNPPIMKSTDLEVIDYVKRTVGSVGYVTFTGPGVNIIKKY